MAALPSSVSAVSVTSSHEPARVDSGAKAAVQDLDQAETLEPAGGHDGQAQRVTAAPRIPDEQLGARLLPRPLPQGLDESALLGDGGDVDRRHGSR